MKKIILILFIFIEVFTTGCSIISPVLGTYRFDPGSTLATGDTFNPGTGCTTYGPSSFSGSPNTSQKEYVVFEPTTVNIRRELYIDPSCQNPGEYQTRIYKYQIRGLISTTTVKTNSLGIVSETKNQVLAYKIDIKQTGYTVECKSQACADQYNLSVSTTVGMPGNVGMYCSTLVFGVNNPVDFFKCNIAQGSTADMMYELMYYDWFNDKVYFWSSYASPADNQPGNFFSGTSDATRAKYIEEGSVYINPLTFKVK